jgi:hypothetical protein
MTTPPREETHRGSGDASPPPHSDTPLWRQIKRILADYPTVNRRREALQNYIEHQMKAVVKEFTAPRMDNLISYWLEMAQDETRDEAARRTGPPPRTLATERKPRMRGPIVPPAVTMGVYDHIALKFQIYGVPIREARWVKVFEAKQELAQSSAFLEILTLGQSAKSTKTVGSSLADSKIIDAWNKAEIAVKAEPARKRRSARS